MRILSILIGLGVCLVHAQVPDDDQPALIMLEVEPLEDNVRTKRQTQYATPGSRYVLSSAPQQADAELPPEYISLLQQLQAEKGIQPQQVDPSDVQQVLISRNPQQFRGPPAPPPPRQLLSPQAQQQRQLQQQIVQRPLREQEERDAARRQQASALQQYYQQQGIIFVPANQAGAPPPQQPPQPSPEEHQQLLQQYYSQVVAGRQVAPAFYPPGTGPAGPVPPPRPAPVRTAPSPPQAPSQQISYSQVQFGSTELPQRLRLASLGPQHPRPQQQYVYAQAPPQQRVIYATPATPKDEDDESRGPLPQQYLIETTKPQPQPAPQPGLATIPRGRTALYYRQDPTIQQLQASLSAQHAQYAEQAVTTTSSPPRSSIYVTQSGKPKEEVPEVRIPSSQGSRPLTQGELKALIDSGFQVTPASPEAGIEYVPYPVASRNYLRSPASKRTAARRVPRPVALSPEEREALAQQGIRNLYRVEPSESQPATYVLAVDPRPQRSTDSQ